MTKRKRPLVKRDRRNTQVSDPDVAGTSPESPPSQVVSHSVSSPAGRQLPLVPLRVWLVASSHKWDQLAGFEQRAKAQGMGPMTIPDWERALEVFLTAPMD